MAVVSCKVERELLVKVFEDYQSMYWAEGTWYFGDKPDRTKEEIERDEALFHVAEMEYQESLKAFDKIWWRRVVEETVKLPLLRNVDDFINLVKVFGLEVA